MQEPSKKRSMSKINLVVDILDTSPTPLHVTEIIKKAKIDYQIDIDRESIVSALSKKVRKGDTFLRTARNTIALR
jgi:predicted transcriptional regulator